VFTLAGLPTAHRQMQMQVGDDLPGGNCTRTPSSTDIPPGVVISTSAELTLRSKDQMDSITAWQSVQGVHKHTRGVCSVYIEDNN